MHTCSAEFIRLTEPLKGLRCDGSPFVTLTNPFSLANWTLPVIELLLVAGAAACLVHAVRRYRRTGETSNVVVWGALVLALILVEPITYFPDWFGVEQYTGLVFAHGQFSVDFLYNRMPLYIVAMYPVFGYVSYALVQRTGILHRYNAFVSGCCVAFVFLALFEVIDTVGPQWRWWIWNHANPNDRPSIGPVPVQSIQMFSIALPFAIAFVATLVSKRSNRGGWFIFRDIVIVSILVWPLMTATSLVPALLQAVGVRTDVARFGWVVFLIAALAAITGYAFYQSYLARLIEPAVVPEADRGDNFALICAVVYLSFGVLFWAAALPAFFRAVDGVAPDGAPTGNLPFAVGALVSSIAVVVGAYLATGNARTVDANNERLGHDVKVTTPLQQRGVQA